MIDSLKYAKSGFLDALKSEPNLHIHLFLGGLAIIMAYFFEFNSLEWAILISVIFFVVILELVNTIVEKLVDFVSTKKDERARAIKDISAAVVLLGAVLSLIVGALLFLPKVN